MKTTKKDECSYSFSNAIRTLAMVRVTGFEPAASCSQSRRATNCATPGYSVYLSGWSYAPKCRALPVGLHPDIHFSAMIPRRVIKIKIFLSVVIYVVKGDFVPFSATGEKPAIARVARLCGVSPHPIPDTTTALPKQARYQLRYTPIRYSLCIANPFLTALIVYWILAGKSTGRLHIPPE